MQKRIFNSLNRCCFKKMAYLWRLNQNITIIYMSIVNERQDEIIEEFEGLDDWMDRYAVIIDMGNAMPALDEQYKTADNLIDGCQSRVWLQTDCIDGRIRLQADSDAIIVKGIISMLVRVLDGCTPQEVLDADLYFIERIGLREHLSPTRSNGLLAMIKQIRAYAIAFQAREHAGC